jgi:hypothetical protein
MRESRAPPHLPHPARPEGRDDFVVTEAGACERGSDPESGRLARSRLKVSPSETLGNVGRALARPGRLKPVLH